MLRAMSNTTAIQANIQATIAAAAANQGRNNNGGGGGSGATAREIGAERTGTSQPGRQPQAHPMVVHGEDGEDRQAIGGWWAGAGGAMGGRRAASESGPRMHPKLELLI